MFLTSSHQYQRVRQILKKESFKTTYVNPYAEVAAEEEGKPAEAGSKKKAADYDSEDPEEYKELQLYTGKAQQGPRPAYIKPIKSKAEAAREQQEKY